MQREFKGFFFLLSFFLQCSEYSAFIVLICEVNCSSLYVQKFTTYDYHWFKICPCVGHKQQTPASKRKKEKKKGEARQLYRGKKEEMFNEREREGVGGCSFSEGGAGGGRQLNLR